MGVKFFKHLFKSSHRKSILAFFENLGKLPIQTENFLPSRTQCYPIPCRYKLTAFVCKLRQSGLMIRPRYSVIADEATDIACNEQFNLSIRYVDIDYGLFALPNTTSIALKDLLTHCNLPLSGSAEDKHMMVAREEKRSSNPY